MPPPTPACRLPQWSNLSMSVRSEVFPVVRMHFHTNAKPGSGSGGDAPES